METPAIATKASNLLLRPAHPPLDQPLKWLNECQAAEITEISVHTLRKNRQKRRGIPYVKIGRTVRYALADVHEHMARCRVNFATD